MRGLFIQIFLQLRAIQLGIEAIDHICFHICVYHLVVFVVHLVNNSGIRIWILERSVLINNNLEQMLKLIEKSTENETYKDEVLSAKGFEDCSVTVSTASTQDSDPTSKVLTANLINDCQWNGTFVNNLKWANWTVETIQLDKTLIRRVFTTESAQNNPVINIPMSGVPQGMSSC